MSTPREKAEHAAAKASEQMFLAAVLLDIKADPARALAVARSVPVEAMTDKTRGTILAAIIEGLESDVPGYVSIQAAARRFDAQDGGSTVPEIAEILNGQYVADPPYAARIAADEVRRAHGKQLAVNAMRDGLKAIRDAGDSSAIGDVIAKLEAAQEHAGNPHAKDLTTGDFDEMEEWSRHESDPVIPTRFHSLDSRIDGGLPVGLIAIAGQPGAGKSALAAQLLLGALLHDRELTALWCRGEMSSSRLQGRIVAAWSSLRDGLVPSVTSREARGRTRAARAVAVDKANIIGNDRLRYLPAPLTVERIAEAIERRKPKLVVVDHLGRIEGDGKHDRRVELDRIVQQLDNIATSNGIHMIVTTPVAKYATEESPIGTITKESNRLDFDAECYLSLWVNKQERDQNTREVRLVLNKTRSGHEDTVPCVFTGSKQFFRSDAPAYQEYDEFSDFAHEGTI